MKVQDLLTDESKWTRGKYARRSKEDNIGVLATDPEASCWCLHGAINKCYLDLFEREQIARRVRNHVGVGVVYWNDDIARDFSEVRDLIVELDI